METERQDYSHGSRWNDEKGNEYMDDHINGVDWHLPDRSSSIINEDGSWNDEPDY